MSEEIKEQPASIGFIGESSNLQIEFADGVQSIPGHIIAELGGAENILKIAPGLKTKTYGEFLSAFRLAMQKKQVNRLGQDFIGGHFSKNFRDF